MQSSLYIEPPEVKELVFTVGPEVAVGGTAVLLCTAFGVPAPTLSWEVTGPPTFSATNTSSSDNSSSSLLQVSPVALSHNGPVSCTASNGVPPTASSSINLTVLCKLLLNTMKKDLLEKDTSLQRTLGSAPH